MRLVICSLLASAAMIAPAPAVAQQADQAELQRQLAAMQAEIARLSAQLAELQAKAAADATPAPAPAAAPAETPAPEEPGVQVTWKGGPEVSSEGGWSFKPRGRMQIDTAVVDAPDAISGNGLGWAAEFRRVYFGVDGTLPGNFGYRLEADFAGGSAELTDVYLTYEPTDDLTLTLGYQKPPFGLEEMTSDLFTSMLERAAFNTAFGFERRVGLSGTYATDDLMVQLGAFTDDVPSLDDGNNSYSFDGRVVFSPRIGEATLHIGGSAHYRELNDAAATVRYRTRPFTHTTDVRLVDTSAFSAVAERSFGAELAYIRGPFHAVLEGHRLTAVRPGLANPSFWGGYAELGMLLTRGDTRGYRNGAFDRIRPANPVTDGGIGAIELSVRYDRIDLTDGAIVGGLQQVAGLSATWIPTDYVRFMANYGHLWISDAAVPAGPDTSYQADTVGLRAQFDF